MKTAAATGNIATALHAGKTVRIERWTFVKLASGKVYQNCNDGCCAKWYASVEAFITAHADEITNGQAKI